MHAVRWCDCVVVSVLLVGSRPMSKFGELKAALLGCVVITSLGPVVYRTTIGCRSTVNVSIHSGNSHAIRHGSGAVRSSDKPFPARSSESTDRRSNWEAAHSQMEPQRGVSVMPEPVGGVTGCTLAINLIWH